MPGDDAAGDGDVVLSLPEDLRSAFKDPFGPLYTDAEALLADAGDPVLTIGDVVTYTLETAGRRPDVSLVDGLTEREAVDEEIQAAVGDGDLHATNPAGTVTESLLRALVEALAADDPIRIVVDGEEDLAAVPAVLAAPTGATVVYGQPGAGMVAVAVTDEAKAQFRELLTQMDGDPDRALALLRD